MECLKCNLLKKVFKKINNNYEYWLMTELFVYLHNGKCYHENQRREAHEFKK